MVNSIPATSRGAGCKWAFPLTNPGWTRLCDRATVRQLREETIPEFRKAAGVEDLNKHGFRMVIEAPNPSREATLYLIAGEGTPCVNPQDWRTAGNLDWKPCVSNRFFDESANTAAAGLTQMPVPFGNRIYLPDSPNRETFGVADGDPKADFHFLMMKTEPVGTMVDPEFSENDWLGFFTGAQKILYELGASWYPARLVANCGNGFQLGPRVHMHVMAHLAGFPALFPHEYGFFLNADGTIKAPAKDEGRAQIFRLIEERKAIAGFTPEAKQERRDLDRRLFSALKRLNGSSQW